MAENGPSPSSSDADDRSSSQPRLTSTKAYLNINGYQIDVSGIPRPAWIALGIVPMIVLPIIYTTHFASRTTTSPSTLTETVAPSSRSENDIDPRVTADITGYTEEIHRNPNDSEAYNNRGYAYSEIGDFDRALADFEAVIRLSPDDPTGYMNRGVAKFTLGDTAGAMADYETAINLGAREALLYFNRALAKEELGDIEGAIEEYTKAISVANEDPDLPEADAIKAESFGYRGDLKIDQGDWPGAIADLDQAVELQPDNAYFVFRRGLAKEFQEDIPGAMSDYSTAIRLNPTEAGAYALRGGLHNFNEDYAAAVDDFSAAIRLEPQYAGNYSSRALAHEFSENYAAALADYDEAIRLDPTLAEAFYGRGSVKRELDDQPGAIADLTQAAELYRQQGDTDSAQAVMDSLQDLQ